MEMNITFPGGLKVDAQFGDTVVHTDQPAGSGGEGSAPSPFELFLASLGTCAGIYVYGYCRNHGLATEGLRLTERIEFDPASHRLARVGLDIHVPAGFPEKHRKALERSAELCAVKRAVQNPPEFVVRTVVE